MSVNYAIIEHLKSQLEAQPGLASAIATLEQELSVDSTNADEFSAQSYFPNSLTKIFDAGVASLGCSTAAAAAKAASNDPKFESFSSAVAAKGFYKGVDEGSLEYLQRQAKLVAKFQEKSKVSAAPQKDANDVEAEAEVHKGLGNSAVADKDFEGAIKHYTEALDLSPVGPNSHVYYSNRAAAYCHLKQYKEAINDCEASVHLQPNYVKALARLGLAHYWDGNYAESVDAYEKAVAVEPGNKANQDSLLKAKAKLNKIQKPQANTTGGMPGGLGGLLGNPGMMEMAQKMMQNPAMMAKAQEMMKNPDMMQQAMSMMGGAGMPDMSALADMMGGGAGGAPSSSGAKSD